jgi:alpha-1,2-mannosyltransferase
MIAPLPPLSQSTAATCRDDLVKQRWQAAFAVGVVAFMARLGPVLRTGGLHTINQYDASVYFGSAVALLHGRIPYRDFLLLHPPGITLALVPFAALTFLIGDSNAMAVARIAWMGLGALNSILVGRILAPLGTFAAVFGALLYAVSYPAVTIEQTTRLEGLGASCLLAALVLLREPATGAALRPRTVLLAGIFLGLSASVKIWGVVPMVSVALFLLLSAGVRRAAFFTVGAALAVSVVCLPFLLLAPSQMWRYVVADQLGRASSSVPVSTRLADLTGVGLLAGRAGSFSSAVITIAVACCVVTGLVAWRTPQARLAAVLLGSIALLLIATPSWLPHYAGLISAPASVSGGAASDAFLRWSQRLGRSWWLMTAVALLASLVAFSLQLSWAAFGRQFPEQKMAAAVAPLSGCITADDPGTLIGMNVLSRNLERGCPLSLDLGGYSYDIIRPGHRLEPREHDPLWQRHALDYLSSGSATVITRYSTTFGFSRATSRIVKSWPVLLTVGRFKLRQPTP